MSQSEGEELEIGRGWRNEPVKNKCMSHSGIFEIFSGDVEGMEEEQCVGGQSEPKEAQQVRLLASGQGGGCPCKNGAKLKIVQNFKWYRHVPKLVNGFSVRRSCRDGHNPVFCTCWSPWMCFVRLPFWWAFGYFIM